MPPPTTWLRTDSAHRSGSERGQRRHAEHEVGLLGRPVQHPHRRRPGGSRPPAGLAVAEAAGEAGGDALDHPVVVDVAGGGHDDVAGPVVVVVEAGDVVAAHGHDGVASPSTSRPTVWPGNSASAKSGVHEVVGRVLVHPDLFEDHLPLAVDLVGPEGRAPTRRRRGCRGPGRCSRRGCGRSRRCTPWW